MPVQRNYPERVRQMLRAGATAGEIRTYFDAHDWPATDEQIATWIRQASAALHRENLPDLEFESARTVARLHDIFVRCHAAHDYGKALESLKLLIKLLALDNPTQQAAAKRLVLTVAQIAAKYIPDDQLDAFQEDLRTHLTQILRQTVEPHRAKRT
jgi:hypothetical protein